MEQVYIEKDEEIERLRLEMNNKLEKKQNEFDELLVKRQKYNSISVFGVPFILDFVVLHCFAPSLFSCYYVYLGKS